MAEDGAPRSLQSTLDEVETQIPPLEEQVKRLSQVARSLDAEEARDNAKQVLAAITAATESLPSESALEDAAGGSSELRSRATEMRSRLGKTSDEAGKLRKLSQEKLSREMEAFRVEVCFALRAYMATKRKETEEEMFNFADADRDGLINFDEFMDVVTKSDDRFSRDKIRKLFEYLDDDGTRTLKPEDFERVLQVFYKVARPKVDLYHTMGVASGRRVRSLAIDEVVVLVEGPVTEERTKVVRIRCRAMKDGAMGWTAVQGSNGLYFLTQTRLFYKVVGSTTITDHFRVDRCKTIRQLNKGELIELLVWEKEDRNSGMNRIKGKAVVDGTVGWVTTTGNKDSKFLELV